MSFLKKTALIFTLFTFILFAQGNKGGANKNEQDDSKDLEKNGLALGQSRTFQEKGEFVVTIAIKENSAILSLPSTYERYAIYKGMSTTDIFSFTGQTHSQSYVDRNFKPGDIYVAIALVKGEKGWKQIASSMVATKAESRITEETLFVAPVIQTVERRIESTPSGATVIFNNSQRGTTPFVIREKPGSYPLSITMEGFKSYENSAYPLLPSSSNEPIVLAPIQCAVDFSSEPPGATLSVNGKVVGVTPKTFPKVSYGEYLVEMNLSGYLVHSEKLKVKGSDPQRVHAELSAQSSKLTLTSTPSGASVKLNGIDRGVTPLLLDKIPAGEHKLTLSKNSFGTMERAITFAPGEEKTLSLTLVMDDVPLQIVSQPLGAEVFINGKSVGVTPIERVELKPGSHSISFSLPGYVPHSEIVSVASGETKTLRVVLQATPALLQISGTESSSIFLNDVYYGVTPFSSANIAPGSYQLRLEKKGFQNYVEKIVLKPGDSKVVVFSLKAEPSVVATTPLETTQATTPPVVSQTPASQGTTQITTPSVVAQTPPSQASTQVIAALPTKGTLSVSANSPDVALFVNGAFVGRTPFIAELPAGNYLLQLRKEGMQTFESRVLVIAGETKIVNGNLIPVPGTVSVVTTPPGATVSIDGKVVGITPYVGSVSAGRHVIALSLLDHEIYNSAILVESAKTFPLSIALKKLPIIYTITTTPTSAEIHLNGELIGFSPVNLVDPTPGTYKLTIKKVGYRETQTQIVLNPAGARQTLFHLTPLSGDLTVSSVMDAEVYVDGRYYGSTKYRLKAIPAGFRQISVRKFGYYDFNTQIQIIDQQHSQISAMLQEKPKGLVRVTTEPTGAKVYLGPLAPGNSPLVVEKFPEGNYPLVVKLRSYKTYRGSINVLSGMDNNKNIVLEKKPAFCRMLGSPAFWYVTSALCAGGGGYYYYKEKQDAPSSAKRKEYKTFKERFLYAAGGSLFIGFVVHLGRASD